MSKLFKARIERLGKNKESSVKAYATVTVCDTVSIRGVKIVSSEKGLFIAMPNRAFTDKDGKEKYQDICYPISKALRQEMTDVVLNSYKRYIERQMQDTNI